jgi:acetyltransferase-like isoleucine patch superfamily enzyme
VGHRDFALGIDRTKLHIGHFGGITIGPATIGRRCSISQGVTIGVSGRGEKEGLPTIGDEVYLGPGAKLFGKITIGHSVKIGANAVVYKDVEDNAVIAAPGFIVLSHEGNKRSAGFQKRQTTEVCDCYLPPRRTQSLPMSKPNIVGNAHRILQRRIAGLHNTFVYQQTIFAYQKKANCLCV